jgi:hypothetical protein
VRLVANAVLAAARSTGRTIGDAQAPAASARPFGVVYPLYVAERDGTLADSTADGWWQYQVTAVGDTREQAQGLADELEVAILQSTLTVNGYLVGPILRAERMPVERDDDVQPPLFYQTITFSIFVTPGPSSHVAQITEAVAVTDWMDSVPSVVPT